jgi:hypothetical protein
MDIKKVVDSWQSLKFEMPEILIMVGAGLAVLLFGYRIKRVAFFIIWFLIGYNLMGYLIPVINPAVPQIAENQLYQTLLPIAGGLLAALLGFSIEKICVGGICFGLVMLITVQYFGTEMSVIAIGAIIGIIAAGVAVTLMKPAVIIATAVAGAYALTLAILTLATELNAETYYWPILIGIAALGSIFQFATTKRVS